MSDPILVIGATGHVGSHIVQTLVKKGHRVRAMIRRPDQVIDGCGSQVEYVLGDLSDRASLRAAVSGMHTVISTANGVVPNGRTQSVAAMAEEGYVALIEEAEAAGVRHFIQSSVPSHAMEETVPELAGKRRIEERLDASPMGTTIVRNPAFMDVWLVMGGALQAQARTPHATTRRPFGFQRMWQKLTGHLVARYGVFLAPGGADHGAPLISAEDVGNMMAGMVGQQRAYNRVIEAGGPEWLTWRQVAALLSQQTGRRIRVVPMPAAMAHAFQIALRPVWPAASNVMGLVRFIGSYQPRWEDPEVVREYDLPKQKTLAQYLKENWTADPV